MSSIDIDSSLFKHAVEQSGHAIYITDKNGNIIYVNSAFEKTTGYTKNEAIGQNPRILKSGELLNDIKLSF